MVLQRIPTYSQALGDRNMIRSFASQQANLQFSVSTGLKHNQLVKYDTDLPLLQRLRDAISHRKNMMNGIDKLTTHLDVVKNVLESMKTMATDLAQAADQASGDYEDWSHIVEKVTENTLFNFRALLNEKFAYRHVFSGLRFDTAPVNEEVDKLSDIPGYVIPATAIAAGAISFDNVQNPYRTADPQVSWYDSQINVNGGNIPDAFGKVDQDISYGVPIDYSIDSNNEAFQKLFHAARLIDSALAIRGNSDPEIADRQAFTQEAFKTVTEAKAELIQLRESNDVNRNIISEARDEHNVRFQSLTLAFTKVTQVNQQETVLELSQLNNQITASFTALAKRNQLSLVNYLR